MWVECHWFCRGQTVVDCIGSQRFFLERLVLYVLTFLLLLKCVLTQSWPNFCNLMDWSLPGFSVHGISQARILEWLAISFSRGSSWPRDQTWVSCIAGGFFTIWATNKPQQPWHMKKESDAAEVTWHACMHWRRKWQPAPVFLPGESRGRRSLVGCRLWGRTVGHDWSDLAAAAVTCWMMRDLWQTCSLPVTLQKFEWCHLRPANLPRPNNTKWMQTYEQALLRFAESHPCRRVTHQKCEQRQNTPLNTCDLLLTGASQVVLEVKNTLANAGNVKDTSLIPE